MILSKLEQKILQDCTAVPNGGDLDYEVLTYGKLLDFISRGAFPNKTELSKVHTHLKYIKEAYDLVYFDTLDRQPVNPLILEQKAWQLLSPLVEKHLEEGIKIINKYPGNKMQEGDYQKRFERFIRNGLSLFMDKWRILIMSYRVKEQSVEDEIPLWEKKLQQLIENLSKEINL